LLEDASNRFAADRWAFADEVRQLKFTRQPLDRCMYQISLSAARLGGPLDADFEFTVSIEKCV
jgi:hypothetical protein